MPCVLLARCRVASCISSHFDISSALFSFLHKASKTGFPVFPLHRSFFSVATGCSAADQMKSPPLSLPLCPSPSGDVEDFFLSFFLLLFLCFFSSPESFLEGSFVLTLQSLQFNNGQVSIQEKEMTFVLGWSPFTEECSFYRGRWIWFEIETGTLLCISMAH